MANRILILDATGAAIYGFDCHHGSRAAADWANTMLQRLSAAGIDCTVLEIHPEQGGDEVRRGVIGSLHRLRAEFHTRPDGQRELVGLSLFPPTSARDKALASNGVGAGLGKAQAAATPLPVRAAMRLLAAPADVVGPRHPIRIPRGRMNPDPGQPRTPAEARQARRLARAQKRATR